MLQKPVETLAILLHIIDIPGEHLALPLDIAALRSLHSILKTNKFSYVFIIIRRKKWLGCPVYLNLGPR